MPRKPPNTTFSYPVAQLLDFFNEKSTVTNSAYYLKSLLLNKTLCFVEFLHFVADVEQYNMGSKARIVRVPKS